MSGRSRTAGRLRKGLKRATHPHKANPQSSLQPLNSGRLKDARATQHKANPRQPPPNRTPPAATTETTSSTQTAAKPPPSRAQHNTTPSTRTPGRHTQPHSGGLGLLPVMRRLGPSGPGACIKMAFLIRSARPFPRLPATFTTDQGTVASPCSFLTQALV